MARYLVTGASGLIGSRVATLLAEVGHEVIGVDNLNTAYDVRLKHWWLEQLCAAPGILFRRLDSCDRDALADLFHDLAFVDQPIDVVIHADGVHQLAAWRTANQSWAKDVETV